MIGTCYNTQGLATSLDSTLWVGYAAQAKYDEAGRACPELANGPLEWTPENGVKTSRLYYPWSTQGGRLQSISSVTGTTPAITRQNLSYGYDANGNVTSMQDTVAGESLTYTYDSMNRLTGVSGAYSESYTYNSTTGNLASKGGQTLTYGASNHPHAATSMGSNTYTYDLNGNMLTRKISGVTYTLGYDAEGRLVSISGGGMSASYTYNGDGERVKTAITVSGATKTTAYVGDYFEVSLGTPASTPPPVKQNCVTSKCAFLPFVTTSMANLTAGQAWTSYYSLGGQRIAIRVQSRQLGVADGTYYPLSDQLGSTTVTLDASANRFGELRYKAWGQTRYTYGTTPTQRRYTGQLEAEASLYFYNARWYDSAYDRYQYVYSNPVRYTDSGGHCIDGITTWACIIIIGGVVLKAIDYGWTAYDAWQSTRVTNNPKASQAEKDAAALNLALAIGFEAMEPDDFLPISLPLDDLARKGLVKLGKEAGETVRQKSFSSFASRNFRENLQRLTGKRLDDIVGMEAHHILPQEFAQDFAKAGININDPIFGSWVDVSAYRGWSYAYNQRWRVFLEQKRTREAILNFARDLAKEYKFDVHFPNP